MGNIFLHEGSSGFGDSGKAHVFKADEKGRPIMEARSDNDTQRFRRPVTHGHAAYEAYCEERDWKAYNNETLRDWSEVDPEIKMAWELAAGAAIRNYQKNPGNQE
jgi:hypothetical protein